MPQDDRGIKVFAGLKPSPKSQSQVLAGRRRRSAIGAMAAIPRPIIAHVEGSGTGVKFRNRLLPLSVIPKVPPRVLLANPPVIILNWLGLVVNPAMGFVDVANFQE